MVSRQVDTLVRYNPIPISQLIKMANSFICDIFIECGANKVNAKDYDEVQRGFVTPNGYVLFYFNGVDEDDASNKIEKMFLP